MIEHSFYLSEPGALDTLCNEYAPELSPDEVELIVGRFRVNHYRFAGKLKGEVCIAPTGEVWIRHHFTKKILWEADHDGIDHNDMYSI